MEDYSDALKIFFAPKVYKQLLDYEKTVYRNMMKDFWVKLEHGLCPTMPNFMQHVHIRSKGDHSENEDGCTGEEKEHNRTGCSSDLDNQSKKDCNLYTCQICAYKTRHERRFWRHIIQNHDAMRHIGPHINCSSFCFDAVCDRTNGLRCYVCGSVFASRNELNKDMNLHVVCEILQCKFCGENFFDEEELICHFDVHELKCTCKEECEGDKQACKLCLNCKDTSECYVCGCLIPDEPNGSMGASDESESCDNASKLLKSERQECESCVNCYADDDEIDEQESKCKNNFYLKNELMCHICGRSCFRSNHELRRHIGYHLDIRPHKCDICGKKFLRETHLKRHRVTHTNTDMYECDICQKLFSQKSNLEKHIRSHLSLAKYTCDKCSKHFVQFCSFRYHCNTAHAAKRPLSCKLCEASFALNIDLQRHQRVHTLEKAFVCENCGKRFASKRNIRRHMDLHRPQDLYKCNVCGKKFKTNEKLLCHMKTKKC